LAAASASGLFPVLRQTEFSWVGVCCLRNDDLRCRGDRIYKDDRKANTDDYTIMRLLELKTWLDLAKRMWFSEHMLS